MGTSASTQPGGIIIGTSSGSAPTEYATTTVVTISSGIATVTVTPSGGLGSATTVGTAQYTGAAGKNDEKVWWALGAAAMAGVLV